MTDGVQMDATRRAAIKARCEAATPGPWPAYARDGSEVLADEERWHLGFDVEGPPEPDRGRFERSADALFVSHARQDVPDLLAALDQAEAENARLREQLMTVRHYAVMGGDTAAMYAAAGQYGSAYRQAKETLADILEDTALSESAPVGEE